MIPNWLHILSIASLLLGAVCAAVITADVMRHKQHMWIMNIVWPVTALFGTIWIVWQYFAYGRLAEHSTAKAAMERGEKMPSKTQTPFPVMVANGALHCGSGCTLGDIVAEWLVFLVPTIAVWFGYQSLFGDKIFAVWMWTTCLPMSSASSSSISPSRRCGISASPKASGRPSRLIRCR